MNKKPNADRCLMPFRLTGSSAAAAPTSFVLNPAAFNRVFVEADSWAHFRVRKFAFRILSGSGAATDYTAAGFVGGVQDTLPSTLTTVSELLPSVVRPTTHTVPSDWIHVSALELAGPLPWYKTIVGTADATEEAPGAVVFAGAATQVLMEYKGLFEFKTSVDPANTPEYVALRLAARDQRRQAVDAAQRAKLMTVLGPIGVSGGTKK